MVGEMIVPGELRKCLHMQVGPKNATHTTTLFELLCCGKPATNVTYLQRPSSAPTPTESMPSHEICSEPSGVPSAGCHATPFSCCTPTKYAQDWSFWELLHYHVQRRCKECRELPLASLWAYGSSAMTGFFPETYRHDLADNCIRRIIGVEG